MVEFVTLLLGLVIGSEEIELTVGAEVARVELMVDSQSCGSAGSEPWVVRCDFGPLLVPRRLEAVARAADGRELGRAEQWVNLPRPRSEATLSLEAATGGRPRRARLIWEAIDFERPSGVSVFFDGEQLSSFDGEWIELPHYDPEATHILSAELTFSEQVKTRADIAFGGEYGDRISSELTALAAETRGRRRVPTAADLERKLVSAGRPLRVVAVERPPLDLVIVREQSAALFAALRYLVATGGSQRIPVRSLLPRILRSADRVYFVFPTASSVQGQSTLFEVMPVSNDVTQAFVGSRGGPSLFQILTGMDFPEYREILPRQRLADAVAIGGLLAASANRRRAVILLRSGDTVDSGRITPLVARHFLNGLSVPLTIWTLQPPERSGEVLGSDWGSDTGLEGWGEFAAAFRQLRASLERQFIIWVEGRHLPQAVELADDVFGLGLARRPSEELHAILAAAPKRPLQRESTEPAGDSGGEPDTAAGDRVGLADIGRIEQARRHLGSPIMTPELGPLRLVTDLAAPRLVRSLHRIASQAPQLYADHFGLPSDLGGGATAVLFADEASYRAFEAEAGVGGGELAGHATSGLIALYAGSRAPSEIEATFLHELVHLLNIRAFGPDIEPWLDEGLADAMAFAGTRGGRLVLEPLDPRRPALAMRRLEGPLSQLEVLLDAAETGRLPRLDELVRLDRASFTAGTDTAILYPLSALWVHYLGSLAPESELFREFLENRSGNPASGGSSLAETLGASFEQLETDFRRWLEALARALLPA